LTAKNFNDWIAELLPHQGRRHLPDEGRAGRKGQQQAASCLQGVLHASSTAKFDREWLRTNTLVFICKNLETPGFDRSLQGVPCLRLAGKP
jgi:hypothetical protein